MQAVPIPKPELRPHRFSIREYLAMGEAGIFRPEDRVELIHGQVVEMSPIGNWHAASVRELARLLHAQVSDDLYVEVQNPVNLSEATQLVPDLAVIRAPRDPWDTPVSGANCLLVIEVAESSLVTDRTTKKALYASAGVAEYWIVDLAARSVEVFRDPANGEYHTRTVYERGSEVSAESVIGLKIPVTEIVPPPDS